VSQPIQSQSQTQGQAPPQVGSDLFGQYSACGPYDEFFDQGKPRGHVDAYHRAMTGFDAERFKRRWRRASRAVDENSMGLAGHLARKISGAVSLQKRRKVRAWQLDAVPVLLDGRTWKEISAAVAQRATMNELLLQDLYGPQRLIREKVVPPTLLYSHPGFLRAIHGAMPKQNPFLQLIAFDMARSPDGRWWFVNDRAESPSGIGFAHENRIVLSQAFPEIFQACKIAQLSPFFDQLQNTLLCLADGKRNVNGVLLGDGIAGKNFFEEAYLARTLGYNLVQGDDLSVRDDGVHFKTLAGLKPVDLVLRRKNSRDCDPLEFDGSAVTGTQGFANAIRQNQVAVGNQLGTGLLESRALMAYGSRICKALLGEELKIPNVATWWCGDPASLSYALDNLDRLSVEGAFRLRGVASEEGRELNLLPLEERKAKILKNPERYVLQERVDRSSVPVWNGSQMQSARLALRTFAVSTGDGFVVMQGGLGRTSEGSNPIDDSKNQDEGGKDVWVQADSDSQQSPALSVLPRVAPNRSGFGLSSRSADNLFWLGRQIERIHFSSRTLRATIQRLIGETGSDWDVELKVLVRCLVMQRQLQLGYADDSQRDSLPSLKETLPATVLNGSFSGSIATAANELLRIGQMERNYMSLDTWRTILRIRERIDLEQVDLQSLLTLADELVVDIAGLGGLVSEGMTRDEVFRFIQIGRRLEHSSQLVFLLRSFFIPKAEPVESVLQTALEVADSIMTYRSRYFANFQLGGVLDLLVTDETNPRSLVWQMLELDAHVDKLPDDQQQRGLSQVGRLSSSLLHAVRTSEIQTLAESWLLGNERGFELLLTTVESSLPKLQSAITNRYFVHADTSRPINSMDRASDAGGQS